MAGRLTRDLQKAVFVLTEDEFGLAKGSARSVEGIHLFDCLSECEELITKFGGHALAAGISLEVENLTLLEAKLNEKLSGECIQSKLVIDQCLNLDEASIVMYEQLQVLAPFGEGNRAPVFMFKDVHIKQISCIGNQKQHLKCTLVKEGETLNVISFNQAHLAIYLNEEDCFDVVGELKINEWNGKKTLQLHMQDIRCESFQVLDLRNTKAYQENVNRLPKGVKLSSFNEANPLRCEHFIIDQMPASFDELFKCMNETKPMTVTLYPLQSDLVLPIREKFAFAYQILKKHQSLALNEQTYKAFLARGINKNEVNFIFQVFFEIELAIIKNGAVFYVQTSEKHDLTKAPSYEAMNSKQQMVEFFELSSGSEIKTTFLNAREESHYES